MRKLFGRSFNYSIIALAGQALYYVFGALGGNPNSPVWSPAYNWFAVWGAAILVAVALAAAATMMLDYRPEPKYKLTSGSSGGPAIAN